MGKGARAFYLVSKFLEESLLEDVNVNTVTYGVIEDVDLSKQEIYPLSHVNIPTATALENALQFNITIIAMDLVDESKEETTDKYRGNDNEQDVLNTQLMVLNKLVSKIRRNRIIDNLELINDPVLEAFTDRFGNKVTGWVLTMDLQIPNDIYLC